MDFGVGGRLESPTGATASGQIAGTPLYMSPEQLRGTPQTAASDLFGLGAIASTVAVVGCLTGVVSAVSPFVT